MKNKIIVENDLFIWLVKFQFINNNNNNFSRTKTISEAVKVTIIHILKSQSVKFYLKKVNLIQQILLQK